MSLLGCTDSAQEITEAPTTSPATSPLTSGEDELLAEIEAEVPGFAGFIKDPTRDVLVVRSTSPDIDLDALHSAIRERFPQFAEMEIELVRVDRDFGQLYEWYEQITATIWSAPALAGQLSYTDIDENENVIEIGVYSESAVNTVLGYTAERGIPDTAVQVVIAERGCYPTYPPICPSP